MDEVASTVEMCYATVLEVANPKPRCHQDWFPLNLWQKDLFQDSLLGLSMAVFYFFFHVVFLVGLPVQISPCYKDASQTGSSWPHINVITSVKFLCPNKDIFWDTQGDDFNKWILEVVEGGDTIQPCHRPWWAVISHLLEKGKRGPDCFGVRRKIRTRNRPQFLLYL